VLQREDDLNEIVQVYFICGCSDFWPSLLYVALLYSSVMQPASEKNLYAWIFMF
jgi:hypothetical protein